MRRTLAAVLGLTMIVSAMAMALAVAPGAYAAPHGPSTAATFTNFVLWVNKTGDSANDTGNSEPAVTIGPDGSVVLGGLSWFLYQTNVWEGSFGTAPSLLGGIDAHIGMGVGGGDEDLDFGSTGTLHASTLMFFFNPANGLKQLGVSAIACPNFAHATDFSQCRAQIIDTTQADRQWITSDGPVVYISYHDSGSSTLIDVQRSLDDGYTWSRVASPIPGHGSVTGDSTFNNDQGPLVVDPVTHNLYAIYAAGQAGIQKGTSADFNQIFVSRSTNMGMTWKPTLVFKAPLFTALNNIFPALAVDPSNGHLFATWSDAHAVWVSMSTDHGSTWSTPVQVNSGDAVTAVFPAIAARDGLVDLAYYGTTAASKDNATAVWNTYLAASTDGLHWTQSLVSDHPNHVGVICTSGTGCANPLATRTMLDLFEIAINANGKAAVIYTDDTLATFTLNDTPYPLPQVIVGYQN